MFLALALLVSSCGAEREQSPVPDPVEVARQEVEGRLSELGEQIRGYARGQALAQELERIVKAEAARPFQARVERGLRYSTVFQREYVDGELAANFVGEEGLNERGRALLEVLERAEEHGLDSAIFGVEELKEWAEALGEEPVISGATLDLNPGELEALVAAASEQMEASEEADPAQAMAAVLRFEEEQDISGLERLKEFADGELASFGERARQMAQLELGLADGALRYAREMRHGNLRRVDWRAMRDAGGSTEIILGRMQETLNELHEAAGAEQIRAVMRALEPSHPQYRGLVVARERYIAIAERRCWRSAPRFQVDVGRRSDRAQALRERLICEGFLAPHDVARDEVDLQVVDEELIEGIERYQETHQLKVDGSPTAGFWRSLSVSVERRIAQIELNMQRWRDGLVQDEEDYILVNIPSFSAQVILESKEQMNFSVVVGRNNRRCDKEEDRWVYPNATPVMASTLNQIVLNPSWWVPARLVDEQIRPKLAKNPDYMAENGFEEVQMADGRRVVRQLPGPENALGRVKFLFPNGESIYLHDSPQQHFFDYTLRAHSAGCVRVSEPLELARLLLDREGREDIDVDEVLATERTRVVEMKEELPVIIEYFTVWVDGEGRPNFLADIYDKDARHWSDDPEELARCSPRRSSGPQLVDGDGSLPKDLDEDLGP